MKINEKIKLIREISKLNKKQFAELLKVSQPSITRYEEGSRTPDFNTIQKFIEIGVSPTFLFSDTREPFDDTYNLFISTQKIAVQNSKEIELQELLKSFTINEQELVRLKEKIKTIKNKDNTLSELMFGNAERMLILLYVILDYIDNDKTIDSSNKFIEIVFNYEFTNFSASKYVTILKDNDYKNLKKWLSEEFDDVLVSELLLYIPELKSTIKKELTFFSKNSIDLVEKFFS